MEISSEQHVVHAWQRIRQISVLLRFDTQSQTRLATAQSEISRNAFKYAGGANVEFYVEDGSPQRFLISIRDQGPGIPNLEEILGGRYKSETGMGLGILGSKRLMDHFEVETTPGIGTLIIFGKNIPANTAPLTQPSLRAITEALAKQFPPSPFEELRQQNQELLRAMEEVRQQAEKLEVLNRQLADANRELEDTNRGVVALYSDLDEKAEHLKRANDIKTRFLSNMTHEFRTPLNSTLGLAKILLDQIDGPLNAEQRKQVTFIRQSAEDLSTIVADLLDLSKVEAGKVVIRASKFRVDDLFGGLRGILKPLLVRTDSVKLIFEDPGDSLLLETDEGKVSQILRNLVSNAIKYTEVGEIRVSAKLAGNGSVILSVSDTGIGIAAEDKETIFEEFTQIESPLQSKCKGTGLGLPLSRKLAILLGGGISLESRAGIGSTFSVFLPVLYQRPKDAALVPDPKMRETGRNTILIIDDDEIARYVLKDLLADLPYLVLESPNAKDGIQKAKLAKPNLIVLDLSMPEMNGFEALRILKSAPETQTIPVIIHTSKNLGGEELEELNRLAFGFLSKTSTQTRAERVAHLSLQLSSAILSSGGGSAK